MLATDLSQLNFFNEQFSSENSDLDGETNFEDQRQPLVYTREERTVLDKYKDKYMSATTPTERKTIAQLDIFPDLFNHWKKEGKSYNRKETRRKSLVRGSSFLLVNKL